jgi:hypothetical protein
VNEYLALGCVHGLFVGSVFFYLAHLRRCCTKI